MPQGIATPWLARRGTGSRGYAPLDNPALPFSARKRKRKSMRPDSLWTNPLDCPFGKWGARYASAVRLVARPLSGFLSARAPDPFPKRAGDLSALRMAAACRGLAPFLFWAAGGGRLCFIAGVWRCRNGVTPHPLRGSSPLRRGAKDCVWRNSTFLRIVGPCAKRGRSQGRPAC